MFKGFNIFIRHISYDSFKKVPIKNSLSFWCYIQERSDLIQADHDLLLALTSGLKTCLLGASPTQDARDHTENQAEQSQKRKPLCQVSADCTATSGTNGCRLQRRAAGDLNQFDSGKCVLGPWGWVPFFLWWIFSSFWPWWCWVLETVDLRYGFDIVKIFSSYGYDVLWLLMSYAVKSQCPSHTKRKHLIKFNYLHTLTPIIFTYIFNKLVTYRIQPLSSFSQVAVSGGLGWGWFTQGLHGCL